MEYVHKTLSKIDGINVYKKNEIPEDMHYKNNIRVGDMIIVAKIRHSVYVNNISVNWTLTSECLS